MFIKAMNNIRGSFRAGRRGSHTKKRCETPLASSQLHRRSPTEGFPPECYALHAPLPLRLTAYSLPSAWTITIPWRPGCGEAYFPLSIPPCISRRLLAFGATNLSVFEFQPSQEPPTRWQRCVPGIKSFAFRLRARHSYFLQISSLYTSTFYARDFKHRCSGRFEVEFTQNPTAFVRWSDSVLFAATTPLLLPTPHFPLRPPPSRVYLWLRFKICFLSSSLSVWVGNASNVR